jgi:hypothetical protein
MDPRAGLAKPKGNTLCADERLRRGHATGALVLSDALRARLGPRGRGLFVTRDVPANTVLAHLEGQLHEGETWPPGDAREVFHVRNPTATKPGAWLLLNPATSAELGNLCNTAGSSRGNNARLALDKKTLRVNVRSTRLIRAGDEVLVPYGRGYTAALGAAAEPAGAAVGGKPGGWTRCARCGRRTQAKALARHMAGFGCSSGEC